jgi:hypothetical protein
MIVGFTGTSKRALTPEQRHSLRVVLRNLGVEEFHHGGCIHADAEAQEVVKSIDPNVQVFIYSSNREHTWSLDSFLNADTVYAPKHPLTRNKDIVRASERLVACPKLMVPEQRSGTWATIRYAKKQEKEVTIIWPDGTISP